MIKNKFHTKNRGAPKSVGPVAIATFATIVNPAPLICPYMHKAPSILAICCTYKLKWKIQIFNERYYKCKKGVGLRSHTKMKYWNAVPMRSHPTTPLKVARTLRQGSQNFFVRGPHKHYTTVRGPDTPSNVVVSRYVAFWQINKCLLNKLIIFSFLKKCLLGPDLACGS